MNATEMIKNRRSIRKYQDMLVSKEDIMKVMEESRFTQSWKNLQIARFSIVQNEEMIARLAKEGVNGFIYNAKTLERAKNVAVLSYKKDLSGKLTDEEYATNKGSEWDMFDAGIACQTFALSAFANGIGTCVMGIINDEKIAEIANIPNDETVAALITFGYPAEEGRAVSRIATEEFCRFV